MCIGPEQAEAMAGHPPKGSGGREPPEMASVQMLSLWYQALSPPLAPLHPPPEMLPGLLRRVSVCSIRSC